MIAALHGFIQWLPLGLPAWLFVITLVVFVHELGHFLVARAFGVTPEIVASASYGPFEDSDDASDAEIDAASISGYGG